MNGAPGDATHPAGFWIRLVAFAIDLVVIILAQFVLQVVAAARFGRGGAPGAVGFFTFVFAVAYPTVLHALTGQTLGKLLTRVRVVALDGEALPLGAALLRAVAFWAALPLTLGIGHIVAGLRKDKRAFHDLIAGSRAERVPHATRVRRLLRAPASPVAASMVGRSPLPPTAESDPRSGG
ncbi:MAG TPA: RDD family protein [Methylomirabilota bacterium]|jgi:uncharacterized RDD family membrane protein YckC